MAHYLIGDVQGCFDAFAELLERLDFNPERDFITFCGDLVNRGGKSLKMLRWAYRHRDCCDSVLGNHDLSLLSKYYLPNKRGNNIEFAKIFAAKDCEPLLQWLLHRPLLIELDNCWVVHAGIYPLWKVDKWQQYADRVSNKMVNNPEKFFAKMYGNEPKHWRDAKTKGDKNRFIINVMTRMRYLNPRNSALNFKDKGTLRDNAALLPWFRHPEISKVEKTIVFGHWSALGLYQDNQVICLDSGKVWGGLLTALRAEDGVLFQV